ncbi:MAG TPA: TlpA disulfide reductase family protein [Bryobacteraceae bacterium]|jgi:thiol-disulfide isomerase/thioredoxin
MRSLLLLVAFSAAACAQSLSGLWDAAVTVNGLEIPFRIELSADGASAKGSFFNGDQKVTSTSGRFEDGRLALTFDYMDTHLDAEWKDGALAGKYGRPGREYPFRARRFIPSKLTEGDVPRVAGLWEVETRSPKGEAAWRFIVRQSGPEVSAAILRVDGDTGVIEGGWRDGRFVLSHFDGARPLLLEVKPQPDGSLELTQNGRVKLKAVRSADARAQGLPEPTDPSRHTSVKDPSEPLHFRFPDLAGRVVSDADPRFRGKVVIVSIGGSWCPNCRDEAPFLVDLYRQYHSRGLEVVLLSFEEAEQLKDPARLRAFIKQYEVPYPVLLCGETGELNAKMPQAVNLNSWPTTFFLGRDGRVRSVHAGYAAQATGEFHDRLKDDVKELIEKLLAEGL